MPMSVKTYEEDAVGIFSTDVNSVPAGDWPV